MQRALTACEYLFLVNTVFGKDAFRDLLKYATLQGANSQHIVVVKFRIERFQSLNSYCRALKQSTANPPSHPWVTKLRPPRRLNVANESTAFVTCLDTAEDLPSRYRTIPTNVREIRAHFPSTH